MSESWASSQPAKFELARVLRSKEPERRDAAAYHELVKNYYNGPAGWFTLITGYLTGHESLAGNLFSPDAFDVRGCKRILDAGCGNGRYLRFLLRQADPDAILSGCDLSEGMLKRAQGRLKTDRPLLLAADLKQLPYRDGTFDAAVCGWVLEHLQDPRVGLRELARVLRPGGKLLVMTVESTITGAICSRLYHCRTTRRDELKKYAEECGLIWHKEHWWSRVHRWFGLGGIVVELRRPLDG
jgi:ubiquinone/menaquinone biosynthesis C-methylase UbiE